MVRIHPSVPLFKKGNMSTLIEVPISFVQKVKENINLVLNITGFTFDKPTVTFSADEYQILLNLSYSLESLMDKIDDEEEDFDDEDDFEDDEDEDFEEDEDETDDKFTKDNIRKIK